MSLKSDLEKPSPSRQLHKFSASAGLPDLALSVSSLLKLCEFGRSAHNSNRYGGITKAAVLRSDHTHSIDQTATCIDRGIVTMWILEAQSLGSSDERSVRVQTIRHYLTAGSHVVGRNVTAGQSNIIVEEDKSISRGHAIVTVDYAEQACLKVKGAFCNRAAVSRRAGNQLVSLLQTQAGMGRW